MVALYYIEMEKIYGDYGKDGNIMNENFLKWLEEQKYSRIYQRQPLRGWHWMIRERGSRIWHDVIHDGYELWGIIE